MKTLLAFVSALMLAASMSAYVGPLVIGFDTARGGSYNLQSQTQLQGAIGTALPGVEFDFVNALSTEVFEGVNGVVIVSPLNNSSPIAPLTLAEQSALSAFVLSGGWAIVVTDSDYTPTNFGATNNSFLAPFGFSATGMHSTPISITNPTGSPISNGPFGLVTSLSGIASGSYAGVPTAFQALGTNFLSSSVGAGYFAPDALGVGSGAVLFIADGNVVHSSWASQENYQFISNFVAFAAIPEPEVVALLGGGAAWLAFGAWVRRRRQR